MSTIVSRNNQSEYERRTTAFITKKHDHIFPAEATILREVGDEFRGRAILDIGVGAGRTTRHFVSISENYVGIDYSAAMVDVARAAHPGVDIRHGDARDLSMFGDEQFDLVCFSFNGIDYVPHEDRLKILGEVRRVTKRTGAFCFSSHNRNCPVRSAHDLSHIRLSWNPLRTAKSAVSYLLGMLNSSSRKRHERSTDEYAILNDEGHLYRLLTYYMSEEKQVEQLNRVGFSTVRSYGMDGKLIKSHGDHADSFMIYYLART